MSDRMGPAAYARRLYEVRDHGVVRSQRFGLPPAVLVRCTFDGCPTYLLQLGDVCISWGPAGAVEEAHASIQHLSRWGRCWWSRRGALALAVDWVKGTARA